MCYLGFGSNHMNLVTALQAQSNNSTVPSRYTTTASALLSASAVITGILLHLLYFKRGEHHVYGARYLQLFKIAYATATALVIRSRSVPVCGAIVQVSIQAEFLLAGLVNSLPAYRAFLSPLTKFPRRLPARLSNLWFSAQCTRGNGHEKLLEVHERYGWFLRVGSNNLLITLLEAVNAIYGLVSKCSKAP